MDVEIARNNAKKIDFFLDQCKEKNLRFNTLKTYDYALTAFYNYALDKDLDFSDADLFDIRDFKKKTLGDYSPRSQNLKLSAIRSFYDVLGQYRLVDHNPVINSFNNKLDKKAITFVNDNDFRLILDYFKLTSSDSYVIGLGLMYYSGLRVGEVYDTDISRDIIFHGDKTYIRVHGKGAKERVVPVFDSFTADMMKLILRQHNSLLPLKLGVNAQTYEYHFKNIAIKHNIKQYSCHDFRRGFAVNLYSKTKDLELLRVLLGHESYNTSLMYIRDATVKVYDLPDYLFA